MPAFLDSWAATNPVTVTLSSYKPSTQTYTFLRSATSTTDGPFGDGLNKYTFKDGYYWLPVPVLDLGLKS